MSRRSGAGEKPMNPEQVRGGPCLLSKPDGLSNQVDAWKSATPFSHLVIDGFLADDVLSGVVAEFPSHDAQGWYAYENDIEVKKATNSWERFGPWTYRLFSFLSSANFVAQLEGLTGCRLFADPGLNGGGLHSHRRGGKLNAHLDYSRHPKLGLQRRLNLIVYVTPGWQEAWGGHLQFWTHDPSRNRPKDLVKSIAPLFNRAVLFDTTQNSWHGLPEPIACPHDVCRTSLAAYYLCEPADDASPRGRALFAPTARQENDPDVLELIRKRSSVEESGSVYVKK